VQDGGDAFQRAFVDVLAGVGKVASPSSTPPLEKVLKQILREVQALLASSNVQTTMAQDYVRRRPMFETYLLITTHVSKNWEQSDMDIDTVHQLLLTLAQQLQQLLPQPQSSNEMSPIQAQPHSASDQVRNQEAIEELAIDIDGRLKLLMDSMPSGPES
jgi:hypothetical protein